MKEKGLKHYYSVLKEEKKPNFLKTKEKNIDFSENQGINKLWQKHREKNLQKTSKKNLLELKTILAEKILKNCYFCHRRCKINRKEKETGYCGVTAISRYSDEFIHHGEEPELVPSHTIFFTGCTMECSYCQNWNISTHPTKGTPVHPEDLAKKIIRRKLEGAKNVNLVGGDPAPHLYAILRTLNNFEANTPIIWNSNMYVSKETMEILDGVIDLYLADFRYGNNKCALKHSDAPEYMETIQNNLKTTKNQENDVLIRHLVLPGHVECCTKPIIDWCVENLGNDVRFNLMFQYRPCYKANQESELNRSLTEVEKEAALDYAKKSGLNNLVGQKT